MNGNPNNPQTEVANLEQQPCPNTEPRSGVPVNRLATVCAKLSDPQYQAFEVGRLVTQQIVELVQRVFRLSFTVEDQTLVDQLLEQIKLSRQLTKNLIGDQAFRKGEDTVNFDGEKFRFFLDELEKLFLQAMQEAGVEERQREEVVGRFREIRAQNDARIRQETAQLSQSTPDTAE